MNIVLHYVWHSTAMRKILNKWKVISYHIQSLTQAQMKAMFNTGEKKNKNKNKKMRPLIYIMSAQD